MDGRDPKPATPAWTHYVVALAAAVLLSVAGGLMTELGDWYYGLAQPRWKPPDWLFGPVWTTIYACAAWSGVTAWRAAPDSAARRLIVLLFGINGITNLAWSLLFFKLQRPDWAAIEIAFLWLSIAALILAFARYSTLAAWLLAPYITWVTFAAALNFSIVQLN